MAKPKAALSGWTLEESERYAKEILPTLPSIHGDSDCDDGVEVIDRLDPIPYDVQSTCLSGSAQRGYEILALLCQLAADHEELGNAIHARIDKDNIPTRAAEDRFYHHPLTGACDFVAESCGVCWKTMREDIQDAAERYGTVRGLNPQEPRIRYAGPGKDAVDEVVNPGRKDLRPIISLVSRVDKNDLLERLWTKYPEHCRRMGIEKPQKRAEQTGNQTVASPTTDYVTSICDSLQGQRERLFLRLYKSLGHKVYFGDLLDEGNIFTKSDMTLHGIVTAIKRLSTSLSDMEAQYLIDSEPRNDWVRLQAAAAQDKGQDTGQS